MMLLSKLILKILRNDVIRSLRENKNSRIGRAFKLGNYANVLLAPSSSVVIGEDVEMRNYCNLFVGKDAQLIIGNRVFMNNYCSINVMQKIEIGENTLFGEGVKLYDHNHQYTPEKVEHQKFNCASIKIGKNCWLGSNVVVLKGVTIGDNCVIGAGCVIHKDVPPCSVIIHSQNQKSSPLS